MKRLFRPEKLKRDRLQKYLETGIQYPCCILEAASGFGKTTAVRQFLEERDESVFWYSLRENEKDDNWLWKRISDLLLRDGYIDFQKLADMPFPRTAKERKVFVHIIVSGLKKKHILVLDDFEENESENLNQLLEDIIIEEIPNLCIVILTQKSIQIPYESLMLQEKCIVIDQNMMCFQEAEVSAFYDLNHVEISSKMKEYVMTYTEGWICAVSLLMIEYVKNGIMNGPYSISRMMKKTVFDQLEEEEQETLMKLSPLENFTLSEAEFVMELTNSQTRIRKCLMENCFVTYDVSHQTYRIHSLLKLVAVEELQQKKGSYDEILYRCGLWYEKQDKLIYSVQQFLKINRRDEVFRILEKGEPLSLYFVAPKIFYDFFEEITIEVKAGHLKPYLTYLYYWRLYGDNSGTWLDFFALKTYMEQQYKEDNTQKNRIALGEIYLLNSIMCINHIEDMTFYAMKAQGLLGGNASGVFNYQFVNIFNMVDPILLYCRITQNMKKEIARVKNFYVIYFPMMAIDSNGMEWLLEGNYNYMIGDMQKARSISEIIVERARLKKETILFLNASLLKMKCCIYAGDHGQFLETLDEIREKLDLQDKFQDVYAIYNIAQQLLKESVIHEEEEDMNDKLEAIQCNNILNSMRIKYLLYGKMFSMQKKYKELLALAEDMKQAKEENIYDCLTLQGIIFSAIASKNLSDPQIAGKKMKNALEIAEKNGIISPFMENAAEVLAILNQEGFEQNQEFLMTITQHCKKFLQGATIVSNSCKGTDYVLTVREIEIMHLVSAGYKNIEISQELHIANVTVEKALSVIYKKLGVSNRAQAIERLEKIM